MPRHLTRDRDGSIREAFTPDVVEFCESLAKSVHAAFREVLNLPPENGVQWAPWVIVDEPTDGNWGAGGLIRQLGEIHAFAKAGVPALPGFEAKKQEAQKQTAEASA